MSQEKKLTAHEIITAVIGQKLEKYATDRSYKNDSTTAIMIYNDIFDSLVEIFTKSKVNACNESINFLAQLYYDSIELNGEQPLDPNIFTQRAKLDNIETRELALMASLMSKSPFAVPFIAEVKRRS